MKPKLTKYQIWYAANKEEVAAKRKLRYKKDKTYRERNLKASRDWRAENRPWENREKVVRDYLLISEFAEQVGCSRETLRNLERKKLLPKTTNGVTRRHYHPKNVTMVTKLVELRQAMHYTDPKFVEKQKALVAKIKLNWKKAA
jgi:hypothetical protein